MEIKQESENWKTKKGRKVPNGMRTKEHENEKKKGERGKVDSREKRE